MEKHYGQSNVMASLATVLREFKNQSFITRANVGVIYANGLQAMKHVLNSNDDGLEICCSGKMKAFRGVRNTWIVWADCDRFYSTGASIELPFPRNLIFTMEGVKLPVARRGSK